MLLLILFAFIAGIVTILSPCILPILPIVLSGSLGGGKRRPFGIITGFILSFTFFTLFLASIVSATGVSADSVRTVSIIIVAVFGASLLLPQFQVLTERMFSKLSGIIPSGQSGTGYWAGLLIGISLGLVWTPCVGPILAAVISLALTGTVSGAALFITLSYATGTAIPLLAITYGGRTLLQKNPWLLKKSELIQKIFGLLMILTAIGIYFNVDRKFQTYILTVFPQYGAGLTQLENNEAVKEQLQLLNQRRADDSLQGKSTMDMIEGGIAAPELIPGGEWFNPPSPEATEGQALKSLRGKVVLIDFWTYTCINCIRTLPYLKSWHEKYGDKGLVIIGVHTPEFAFEKDAGNVQKAIDDFGLEYPIMQDNDYKTWRAYDNRYWPAKYFIDKHGKIRSSHFGEGEYDESEAIIQKLLGEAGQTINMPVENPTYDIDAGTPELYLGYERMEYLLSPESVSRNIAAQYTVAQKDEFGTFAFEGTWTVGPEYSQPARGSALHLWFDAREVFLVMKPKAAGVAGKVRIWGDAKNNTGFDAAYLGEDVLNGMVTVDESRLYKLIRLPETGERFIRLEFLDNNLEVFAFTFG